jgi:hypothetical protein
LVSPGQLKKLDKKLGKKLGKKHGQIKPKVRSLGSPGGAPRTADFICFWMPIGQPATG